ncbi:MAG: hypothetical protein HC942_02735 [Microcoleus sp. SU_5_6]|nr:hypothetical protein [Microcoleus sp. SU_5_6]
MQVLLADRALVYQILSDGGGKAIAEAVAEGCSQLLGTVFHQKFFPQKITSGIWTGEFVRYPSERGAALPLVWQSLWSKFKLGPSW